MPVAKLVLGQRREFGGKQYYLRTVTKSRLRAKITALIMRDGGGKVRTFVTRSKTGKLVYQVWAT